MPRDADASAPDISRPRRWLVFVAQFAVTSRMTFVTEPNRLRTRIEMYDKRTEVVLPHVLVIEDVYLVGQYLHDIALFAGAGSVTVAATQTGAIIAADAKRPSLILSDVDLDEGNGPAAVEEIIARHGALPVIFVTGDISRCSNYPWASATLVKPVSPATLMTAISDAVLPRGTLHSAVH